VPTAVRHAVLGAVQRIAEFQPILTPRCELRNQNCLIFVSYRQLSSGNAGAFDDAHPLGGRSSNGGAGHQWPSLLREATPSTSRANAW
jgi:hypothetical protein